MAVASLVLSLVSCCGIGSILAIIFGVRARRSIRESSGTEQGEGLATAGFVIGIVGLVASLLFWVLVIAAAIGGNNETKRIENALTHRTQSTTLGRTLTIERLNFGGLDSIVTGLDDFSGIQRVTVYSVAYPFPSPSPSGFPTPPPGKQWAVADMQICTGPAGTFIGPDLFFFHLLVADNTQATASPFTLKNPALNSSETLGPHQCIRGFLAFNVDSATHPTALTFTPDPFRTYQWRLPR